MSILVTLGQLLGAFWALQVAVFLMLLLYAVIRGPEFLVPDKDE